ncbi:hypothetical protein ACHHYP_04926 [Achlya hypogyna]|uniref:BAR domain-containing protein n=1 Tax=Achlya hypogyna TaxID=1202772 RepID=A0A1V9YZI6_ACHHY|nr:hypothetical protein ACHHYP_04926 [Achlya hypogyna]
MDTSQGILESFRTSKRRLIQQVLSKMGQADVSEDHEYQLLRDRHLDFVHDVETLLVNMKSFAANLVAMGHGCGAVGNSVSSVRSSVVGEGNNRTGSSSLVTAGDLGALSASMAKIDAKARDIAGCLLSTPIIVALGKLLEELHDFKKELDAREKLKLDYDSARRKLQKAREQQQAQDILRRDAKLKHAASVLASATDVIMKRMAQYERRRPSLFQTELEDFRRMQMTFFSTCAESFGAPPASNNFKTDEISQAEVVTRSPWA